MSEIWVSDKTSYLAHLSAYANSAGRSTKCGVYLSDISVASSELTHYAEGKPQCYACLEVAEDE